jgi:iron(III) transport system ATP-binding protein
VFQNYALFPHLSVSENVAYGLRVQRREASHIASALGEVLSMVGLAGFESQMPHQLSGGEQQRVALARAIVIRPGVLLFDEPLSNLDAKLRVQMRGEIRSLQKKLGITTVYVTHDQEEAMAIADRIAVMNKGEIAQIGDAEELYRRPASVFVAHFIGHANLLSASVTNVGPTGVEIEIGGQPLAVAEAHSELRPGQAVTAVIRPEALAISDAKTEEGLPGRVTSCTYLGDKCEYGVDIAGANLQVTKANPQPGDRLLPGTAVRLNLPATGIHLLPEG